MDIQNPKQIPGHQLLAGKSVMITAAAGAGIGFAAAQRALQEGCRGLMISDIHEERLRKAVDTLLAASPHDQVYGRICDVRYEEHVQRFINDGEEVLGGVDILINNAGLGGTKALIEMEDHHWQQVMDVTLTGTMRMTRQMLKVMQNRGEGVIINNASVLGWRAQKHQSHYAAAKAGVMALTRCSALEAAEFGVRINAVAPSLALHPFLRSSAPPELLQQLEKQEAYGRAAEVWEVANVMMFLASDYSSYLTGEVISCSSQRG